MRLCASGDVCKCRAERTCSTALFRHQSNDESQESKKVIFQGPLFIYFFLASLSSYETYIPTLDRIFTDTVSLLHTYVETS